MQSGRSTARVLRALLALATIGALAIGIARAQGHGIPPIAMKKMGAGVPTDLITP